MTCIQCEQVIASYEDPRDPPVEEDICLCLSCYVDALDEQICTLEDDLTSLKEEVAFMKRKAESVKPIKARAKRRSQK